VVEAVAGLQHISATQDLRSLPTQQVELSDAPLEQPSHAQASDFVRAAETGSVHEVSAAPAQAPSGWTGGMANQIDSLASHLKVLDAGHKSVDSSSESPRSEPNSKDAMADAVSQMERAYMLAIEATMASRGSTEATKIFNTLLKGQ
jgi:hypothetical protein